MQQDCKVLDLLRQHFPTTPFIGDSTQLTYAGNLYGTASAPNSWFNSATGFGTLGYDLPAAIGAAIAKKGTTACLIVDGGLQFCLSELRAGVGVALHTPDFVAIAVAMGLDATRADSKEALEAALVKAKRSSKATLIEIDEQMARQWTYNSLNKRLFIDHYSPHHESHNTCYLFSHAGLRADSYGSASA